MSTILERLAQSPLARKLRQDEQKKTEASRAEAISAVTLLDKEIEQLLPKLKQDVAAAKEKLKQAEIAFQDAQQVVSQAAARMRNTVSVYESRRRTHTRLLEETASACFAEFYEWCRDELTRLRNSSLSTSFTQPQRDDSGRPLMDGRSGRPLTEVFSNMPSIERRMRAVLDALRSIGQLKVELATETEAVAYIENLKVNLPTVTTEKITGAK
jgi:multidrug efflux pump subunit AcrA (membrane-fusion protein)